MSEDLEELNEPYRKFQNYVRSKDSQGMFSLQNINEYSQVLDQNQEMEEFDVEQHM